MAEYIDKPGIDSAEVVNNGRLYPVVMTIPISSDDVGGVVSPENASVPGFNIPEHDTVIITEDSADITVSVEYKLSGARVALLSFSYSNYVPVAPNKTTTVVKSI